MLLVKRLTRTSQIPFLGLVVILALFSNGSTAQQPSRDVSKQQARPTRDWVRDGVIYEIYPRAFSTQGNFNGITARLDDLKDLGVNILWLMPIHPIGQEKKKGTIGSPYAVRDYYGINPDYGTKEDFKKVITEAHRRGMKVIIDIVANHTSWDSVMMKWPEYYEHDASGGITYPHDWSDVAELNYANPQLRRYMLRLGCLTGVLIFATVGILNIDPAYFVRLLFGHQYEGTAYLVHWFCAPAAVYGISTVLVIWTAAMEKTRPIFVSYAVATAFTLIAAYPLTRYGGLAGVAVGSLLVESIRVIVLCISLRHEASGSVERGPLVEIAETSGSDVGSVR